VTISTSSGYLQPALLGGLVMGVLSALPVVSAGNVCCCLWVVAGGITAADPLPQNRSTPITPADGAIVGLLAGIVGAAVQFALAIPIGLLVGPMEREMVNRMLEMSGSMPEATREALETYSGRSGTGFFGMILLRLISFFVTLIVGSVVSTVAGIIGAVLFRRTTPPPPVPDLPPPPGA
jgi:hypothetical protein